MLKWRKSSRSNDCHNCVEVADAGASIAVRDSKLPTTGDFPVLSAHRGDWSGLMSAVKSGGFHG